MRSRTMVTRGAMAVALALPGLGLTTQASGPARVSGLPGLAGYRVTSLRPPAALVVSFVVPAVSCAGRAPSGFEAGAQVDLASHPATAVWRAGVEMRCVAGRLRTGVRLDGTGDPAVAVLGRGPRPGDRVSLSLRVSPAGSRLTYRDLTHPAALVAVGAGAPGPGTTGAWVSGVGVSGVGVGGVEVGGVGVGGVAVGGPAAGAGLLPVPAFAGLTFHVTLDGRALGRHRAVRGDLVSAAGQALATSGALVAGSSFTVAGTSPTFWVYADGRFAWPGDFSYSAVPDYTDRTGAAPGGYDDIRVTLSGPWGGWQPYAPGFRFDSTPYRALTFELEPTEAGQRWSCQFVRIGDVPVGVSVDVARFGPAPVVGRWARYTIPLADLGVARSSIYKFAIQDQTGRSSDSWYVDNVGFTG